MNGWIERQWFGGRAAVERWRGQRAARAHERRPVITVHVREQVAVPHSAAELWAFVTDPANDRELLGPQHVRSFTVPGTPRDEVGEIGCVVVRLSDGAWRGFLSQTEERVEGLRLVVRSLSDTHERVDAVTVADGLLTWEVTADTHPESADAIRAGLAEHVGRCVALLAGEALSHPVTTYEPRCGDASTLVDLEVTAALDVRHSPQAAWAVVGDAAAVALETNDPTAVSFTVPGSRRGEVGELVCVIQETAAGGRMATFQQVVGRTPGRSIVFRGLSAVAEHAWEREVCVDPAPGGARLSSRVRVPVHERKRSATRYAFTRGAERYLAVIADEMRAPA